MKHEQEKKNAEHAHNLNPLSAQMQRLYLTNQ